VHKDVDIAVGRRDHLRVQEYLTARRWQLQVAHQGTLSDWPAGEYPELPRHGIWCRQPAAEPDFVEVLLNPQHLWLAELDVPTTSPA
jgi:hypothetical protein